MAHAKGNATPFYGLMAEFDSAQALIDWLTKELSTRPEV